LLALSGQTAEAHVGIPPIFTNAYDPCLLQKERSKPERAFEDWLEGDAAASGKVAWWMKNGEKEGTDPSLAYLDPAGTRRNFFPYSVCFTDGCIALFETKEFEGAFVKDDARATNAAKLGSLRDWVAAAPVCSSRDGAFIVQFSASGVLRWAQDDAPKDASAAQMWDLLARH